MSSPDLAATGAKTFARNLGKTGTLEESRLDNVGGNQIPQEPTLRPISTDPYIFFKSDRERRLALRHRENCSLIKKVLHVACIAYLVIATTPGPGGQMLKAMRLALFG